MTGLCLFWASSGFFLGFKRQGRPAPEALNVKHAKDATYVHVSVSVCMNTIKDDDVPRCSKLGLVS